MERGEFEHLVRSHLDEVLVPRGFTLTPQPPPDVFDQEPAAVYEAEPADFERRYPTLAEDLLDNVACVDLWVKLDPGTGFLSCELEGAIVDFPRHPAVPLQEQLGSLATTIASVLDADRI